MNIIRDEDQDGMNTPALSMIPLLVQWKIKRCNWVGCTNSPTTIIAGAGADIPVFGMFEHHYQGIKKLGDGKYNLTLEF